MKNNLSVSSRVFDELLNALEMIGIENTIKSLQEAQSKSLILSDIDMEFILKSVSDVTEVPKDTILHGFDRTDERKIATSLSIYFIKKELDYSFNTLKKVFKKDTSVLSRYNSIVEKLPKKPKSEFDKKIADYYNKINFLINEKKIK